MILLESFHRISLGCGDIQKSVAFYRDILDFEVVEEEETHAVLHLDPLTIRLNFMEGFKNSVTNPAEFSLSFILDVDDFTNAIMELEKNEVEILDGPLAIDGGESLLIADPSGNLIELFYQD